MNAMVKDPVIQQTAICFGISFLLNKSQFLKELDALLAKSSNVLPFLILGHFFPLVNNAVVIFL